jgi:FixJ family two-component response regulator
MPFIFVMDYSDVPMTVEALKAGAVEFLTKPPTPIKHQTFHQFASNFPSSRMRVEV